MSTRRTPLPVSEMAENLIGSEIIKLAAEINDKMRQGEHIYNFTIGDFDPAIFPIPGELNDAIIDAYEHRHTNYPAANGMLELRKVISDFVKERQGLNYSPDEVLISGGARPLIYATYITLLDPGDTVVFPVPSWNNNHYCHLSSAKPVLVETKPENNFMPTAEELRPYLKDASLLALCSPLNPTGTVFNKSQLEAICDLVVEENARRDESQKPLYLMCDQIYSVLTFGDNVHHDPVRIRPELREYTIFVDGLSKSLAATGIRVGWSFGPQRIIDKMKAILSHIGAWAPKAEQIASADYLKKNEQVDRFLSDFKKEVSDRLVAFHRGFEQLKSKGFSVEAIAPQAAIYLTVKFDLVGKKKKDGNVLSDQRAVTQHLLNEAKLAVVPFSAFGASDDSPWYRLSVGTCDKNQISDVFSQLEKVLGELTA
ncbi:MAG: pyridoxal phosphate-dependent aminotransferase [Bacteroidota bacterium]